MSKTTEVLLANNRNFVVERAIYQTLSTAGDGTGTISQNVDGSSTSVKFYIEPPAGETYVLRRLNLHAIDGNWNNATQYGGLGTALTNGIKIYVERDTTIIKDYTEFKLITRTHDWSLLAGVDSMSIGGAGADPFLVRWTFSKGCDDIELNGDNSERFVVEIQDDLTGLSEHLCLVQGYSKEN